jgi:GH43 family beta-xylosidase
MPLPPLPIVPLPELPSPVETAPARHAVSFTNPIIPAPSADPWMIAHEGYYFYCESRNQSDIFIRKSRTLTGISRDEGVLVWRAPGKGMNCDQVWAPELHLLNGKWHIYYAASDGQNENHQMWVLESVGADPLGPYLDRGCLNLGGWAIDGTVLQMDDGQLYYIWSGWPGRTNGQQNIYIAPMKDPATISGPRVLICAPEHDWECVDMAIAEGPQILKRNGMIFIVYSASGSWTVDYCLGLLINRDGDVLNPASWEKRGPVLRRTQTVWGIGHCSFVKSRDQREDWILYHVKSKVKKGWMDRRVHAQPFTWNEDGTPCFGSPPNAGASLPAPSGEEALLFDEPESRAATMQ